MRPFPPIAFFTLFCLGTLAVVGYVLASANGLSELHKTVLVGFLVGFPILTLLIFLILMPKEDRAAAMPFRSRKAELAPEPLAAMVN
ncbi:MAG: hypothetical protein ABI832_07235 [bacterium]